MSLGDLASRARTGKDLTGQRFGRQVVTGYAGTNRHRAAVWIVRCDCGSPPRAVPGTRLTRGRLHSCGCLTRELTRQRLTTHGASRSPEFQAWTRMAVRCGNPHDHSYADYGGRGIAVCDRWRESFESFLEDMGPRPSAAHSLDRIDVNGHYEPGNCRWATTIEQGRNKRGTVTVTIGGVTKPLTEWCEISGVRIRTARDRLQNGRDPAAAVSVPAMTRTDAGRARHGADEWSRHAAAHAAGPRGRR